MRFEKFTNGEIEYIDELEDDILPMGWNGKGNLDWFPVWRQTVCP